MEDHHRLTLRFTPGSAKPHSGRCSCGWESGPCSAAGIVHGRHNHHLDHHDDHLEAPWSSP